MAVYERHGGRPANTVGRRCRCNALLATAGLAQQRPDGHAEPAIVTIGTDYTAVHDLIAHLPAGQRTYTAHDVVTYLDRRCDEPNGDRQLRRTRQWTGPSALSPARRSAHDENEPAGRLIGLPALRGVPRGRRRAMGAKTKRWTGRIKQAAGTLTGNRKLEREGRADRRSGEAEERLTQARGKVNKMIDKAADALKGTIRTGKGTPRRK